MKILALTRYGRLGASSRLRILQYLPYLEAHGASIDVAPLVGDEYVRRLYAQGTKPAGLAIAGYGRRLMTLLTTGSYDLLWIEKEIFPWLPAWAEALISNTPIPYVVDYDDAVFHHYDAHRWAWVRWALGAKIDSVMRHAALVVAGNDYLAERARQAGAQRVEYLPTVVDLERYRSTPTQAGENFTLGWIGSPVTAKYLSPLYPVLAELSHTKQIRIVLVGAGEVPVLPGVPMETRPWTEENEVNDIANFDAGIMPLPDGPWERGKCGYKLIQYMACGRPVVASPVGVNTRLVTHGENGFLAGSSDEWRDALLQLHADAALRRRMGEAGRCRVEKEYCLQVTAPCLLSLLQSVC